MTNRPGKRGRSKIARHLLAGALTLSMGYVLGLFALGGCGSSQAGFAPPADGQLPERVVEKLTDCSRRGPAALQPVKHTVAFDVFMNSDGQVEQVALRDSTFHLDEVEACMGNALQELSDRAMDASLRRRDPGSPSFVPPSGRPLLANPVVVIGVGVAEAVLVVGAMMVVVVVYYQVVRGTKTHRPPPPWLQVGEPPKPEPPKPEPQTAGDPKTTGPTPPLPPPPPPPKEKETCEEQMADRIRCDEPKLSHYPFRSEDAAFKAIVSTKGKGLRKAKREADARRGPCPNRGGFHTNVLRGGDSVASIVGCNCCDDSSGKAVGKQRATVIDKQ